MNSGVPSTDLVAVLEIIVASPKSPNLISPVLLFIKILSHLISRCITGRD